MTDAPRLTHTAYALKVLGKRHRRYIAVGGARVEASGEIRVYLDTLPIGGFNGFLHLLPEGMPPPDTLPQRPGATSESGDDEESDEL